MVTGSNVRQNSSVVQAGSSVEVGSILDNDHTGHLQTPDLQVVTVVYGM